ncbi:VanZ family protein [Amedibacillus sp. YH-ame6]
MNFSRLRIQYKPKQISITFWIITILWLIFIFALSSQNGTQTSQTSSGIAKDVAEFVYSQPTESQVNSMHMNIRELAHIGFFFILGVLSFLSSIYTFGKKNYKVLAFALIIPVCYGYFDEWHKQFIDGRHFQLEEAVLNIVSGVIGVVVAIMIFMIVFKIKTFRRGIQSKND